MLQSRPGEPAIQQTIESLPTQPVLLAAAQQTVSPQPAESCSKPCQAVDVPWYRVIVEVASHDRLEPLSRFRHRVMPPPCQFLLQLLQLDSHAFGYGLALHGKGALPVLPTDVSETQK